MSQRTDTLNTIRNEAQVRDVLLRPLSARILDPTPMELSGLVDRSRLLALNGRGRRGQFELAAALGITDIPAQGGGCRLTERECGRRYWPVLRGFSRPLASDFDLANVGRQFWRVDSDRTCWLCVGRDERDNARLFSLVRETDYVFTLQNFPGPAAVGRPLTGEWPMEILREASARLITFAPRARKQEGEVAVRVVHRGKAEIVSVSPRLPQAFGEALSWEQTRELKKNWEKELYGPRGVYGGERRE